VGEPQRGVDPLAPLQLKTVIQLGGLAATDLHVEFRARRLLPEAQFDAPPLTSFGHGAPEGQWSALFSPEGAPAADGSITFAVAAPPPGTGQYQLQVRVYPWHPLLSYPLEMGLMKTL
jgi:hypothetical protein